MQPRAVRVSLPEADARLNGRNATLVNISRSGALLRVHEAMMVGADARLTLSQRSTTIELAGRVVRESMAARLEREMADAWQVGISFVEPPPDVTAALRRLIAQR